MKNCRYLNYRSFHDKFSKFNEKKNEEKPIQSPRSRDYTYN